MTSFDDVIVIDSRQRSEDFPDSSFFQVPFSLDKVNIKALEVLHTRLPHMTYNVTSDNNRMYIVHGVYMQPGYVTLGGKERLSSIESVSGTIPSPRVLEVHVDPGFYDGEGLVAALNYSISQALSHASIVGEDYVCELVPHTQRVRIRCEVPTIDFTVIPVITSVALAQIILDSFGLGGVTHSFASAEELFEKTNRSVLPVLGFSTLYMISNHGTKTLGYDPSAFNLPESIDTMLDANVNMVCGLRAVNVFNQSYVQLYITELNDNPTSPGNLHLLSAEEQKTFLQGLKPIARVMLEPPFGEAKKYEPSASFRRVFEPAVEIPSTLTIVWATPDNVICNFYGVDCSVVLRVEDEFIPQDLEEL